MGSGRVMAIPPARSCAPADDLVLAVAPVEAQFRSMFLDQRTTITLDVRQGLVAVHMRLALAKQIEIGPFST
jgi:hypothetical protein